MSSDVVIHQLVAFCDASNLAYCSTVYLKLTRITGESDFYLIASKTKVAPIAKAKRSPTCEEDMTIHRLELMAVLLLSKLVQQVGDQLNVPVDKGLAFSDSQVALCWMAKPPENWKLFVQNRVAKIQSIVPFECWSYVRSRENPADLGMRQKCVDRSYG